MNAVSTEGGVCVRHTAAPASVLCPRCGSFACILCARVAMAPNLRRKTDCCLQCQEPIELELFLAEKRVSTTATLAFFGSLFFLPPIPQLAAVVALLEMRSYRRGGSTAGSHWWARAAVINAVLMTGFASLFVYFRFVR